MIGEMFDRAADLGAAAVRAWPSAAGELTVELHLPAGPVPGRYLASAQAAEAAADQLPGTLARGRFLLQPHGVDPALPSLVARMAAADTTLVSHRPGRRAVLHRGDTFTKVVKAKKLPALLASTRAAEDLPIRTPRLIGHDRDSLTMSALPGRTLHALLHEPDDGRLPTIAHRIGTVLAALHRHPIPEHTPEHGPEQELAVLTRWQGHAAAWGAVVDRTPLPDPPDTPVRALLHRDLHDKQILVDDKIGVIDFDLLAAGHPALDLANLVVHLELRAAHRLPGISPALVDALIEGYAPSAAVAQGLPFYREVAVRRVRAVQFFRFGAAAG